MSNSNQLILHEDRFFDPEPAVRRLARDLYEDVKELPIVSPHGHTDPAWFSGNEPFADATQLIIIPDHYVFRMLYSQGVPMEALGVPTQDGTEVETDHCKIWQLFADHFHLFAGTPTAIWLNYEFSVVFGIEEKLTSSSAMRLYEQIHAKLQTPEFRPRALFQRFNIEVLTTTDAADSDLTHHREIGASGWHGKVLPCFRPDGITEISRPDWKENVTALGNVCGFELGSYKRFIAALEDRRTFFREQGCVSTDHAVVTPYTHDLSPNEAEAIFQRALKGSATDEDAFLFSANLLMEMARMSLEDGLVMQIHPGSLRNHNQPVYDRFGADKGCDIPVQTEYTRNLHALLNKFGNQVNFGLVLFTLDESTYSRELAPLAGHYPALKLGPPWWFHDSIEGMTRFRERVLETAGIYNTAGFNDDTRAFVSIPARHDLARRIDCNYLGRLLARHIIDRNEAEVMAKALAYDLVKSTYKL